MKNTSFKLSNFEAIKCDSQSHKSVCFYDQVKHDSMLSEPACSGKPMPEYVSNSSGHDAGGRWKPLQKCSQVCGMCVSRSSLSKARYQGDKACHSVRSLRDLTPNCVRHVGVLRLTSGRRTENRVGRDASRCYDKLMIIRGLMVCGEERGGMMVNMLSRGRFRRDLRRRLQKRGMRHLRSP
ncbi:MAG: hypothetical protein ACI30M_05140 [Muribaculaceae bacterium]